MLVSPRNEDAMSLTPREVNESVKCRINGQGPHPIPINDCVGWITKFSNLPKYAVTDIFGTSGEALHVFLRQMDPDHPDLDPVLREKIFSTHSLSVFMSIVGLAELATRNEKTELLPPLSSLDLLPSMMIEAGSVSTKSFIRCIQSPQRRDELRKLKKPQVIDMTTVSRKGEELWNTQPNSFESLIRYEDAYSYEIAAAKRRASRFLSLGCKAMYAEVMKTVESFQSQVDESYFGFNRLTFNAACVILAKWHNYNLVTPYILSDFPPERNYKVVVDAKRFNKLSWDFFARPEDRDLPWTYSPRVYPIDEMEPLPKDVKDIVDLCENYHGFGGKPLFDNYAVMVPGIDYPPLRDGLYTFRNRSGIMVTFEDQNEARFALDKTLLEANAFSAVLMGERDSKCYCLSVWS